ncbi:hypothetical protein [Prochlorococcus marinus]|uniref:hypothetical protein n=1 Tax=Prochlorococcus marinus TaxID=1219 RepID=UPI001ADD3875|nr:hypothetical protein [Prochlorococcus marinus]MBO8217070.1 hypothetical protein [Prochlorococcus marinus XMU1405]MBW3040297.1 hypothetical protein [Prochlorococcus marinus str. MU1405]MBW3047755.1 hypothetical protein [Prochlorococcus marinus str. MU1406]
MKLALNLALFLFIFFSFYEKSFSLSAYKIKEICKKERSKEKCIKNLEDKKYNLKKGNLIEIPVIPYKR